MSDMSKWKKLMESLNENNSEDHNYTDHEVSMARSQLLSVVKSATNIAKNLKDRNEDEGLEGWVASKLTMAEDYLQAVSDHMSGQALEEGEQKGSCPQCGKSKHMLKACASCGCNEGVEEGYKVMPPMDPKYVERKGLEGPFTTLSGKVVYYDPKEGKYYDSDTDMYLSYDEFQNYDTDYSNMKDERDEVEEGGLRPSFAKELRNAELNKDKGPASTDKTTGPDDYDFLQYKNKDKKEKKASGRTVSNEEKTRLDPKCWDDKKIGKPATKMKNGVRVNNCVPK